MKSKSKFAKKLQKTKTNMEHPGEVWQEFDFNGERLGGVKPHDFDESKIRLTGGAAIMLYRVRNGEVEYLFQHRSKFLKANPDKWDVSAGGHVNLDEAVIDAAIRETNEEIGAKIEKNQLEFAEYYRKGKLIVFLYFCNWNDREDEFSFDDQEVEEVKWVKYSEIESFWPNLKPHLIKDQKFFDCLGEWNEKILNGNI